MPACPFRWLLIIVTFALVAAPPMAQADDPDFIYADPFEVFDADAFRVTQLLLRDPHVFALVSIFGCTDITDTVPFNLFPSVNAQINTSIATDGDGDGLFDLSSLLLFRPLDQTGAVRRLDTVSGDCLADPNTPGCVVSPGAEPRIVNYASLSGSCLGAIPGTTRPYSPAVPQISGNCFTTSASSGVENTGNLALPLLATRSGGVWNGATIEPGLLRGFLRESDADQVLLPPDLPLVGGQPLSSLFPGGTGNCNSGDDRDLLAGESGWWVYLEYRAAPVPFAP